MYNVQDATSLRNRLLWGRGSGIDILLNYERRRVITCVKTLHEIEGGDPRVKNSTEASTEYE